MSRYLGTIFQWYHWTDPVSWGCYTRKSWLLFSADLWGYLWTRWLIWLWDKGTKMRTSCDVKCQQRRESPARSRHLGNILCKRGMGKTGRNSTLPFLLLYLQRVHGSMQQQQRKKAHAPYLMFPGYQQMVGHTITRSSNRLRIFKRKKPWD